LSNLAKLLLISIELDLLINIIDNAAIENTMIFLIMVFLYFAAISDITNLYIVQQKIASIALVVKDYDEAIEFYTQKLQFDLIEDTTLSPTKRFVRIAPKGDSNCCLLLAKAKNEEQLSRVGNQAGSRVFLFLHTDNFERDYQNLLKHKIKITRPRTKEPFGTVAVFEDLYGNLWDLVEPVKKVIS